MTDLLGHPGQHSTLQLQFLDPHHRHLQENLFLLPQPICHILGINMFHVQEFHIQNEHIQNQLSIPDLLDIV